MTCERYLQLVASDITHTHRSFFSFNIVLDDISICVKRTAELRKVQPTEALCLDVAILAQQPRPARFLEWKVINLDVAMSRASQ